MSATRFQNLGPAILLEYLKAEQGRVAVAMVRKGMMEVEDSLDYDLFDDPYTLPHTPSLSDYSGNINST